MSELDKAKADLLAYGACAVFIKDGEARHVPLADIDKDKAEMSDVRRYEWRLYGDNLVEMELDEHGTYVRYEDYERLQRENAELRKKLDDLNEVLNDKRRLTRELDVAMNGESGAAKQASLCDLIWSANQMRKKLEWQPIATAPKDGTQVLLGREAGLDDDGEPRPGVVAQGYWQDGCEDGPDVMGYDACWVDNGYTVFMFPRSFGNEAYRTNGYQPTHWMPLPEPPL